MDPPRNGVWKMQLPSTQPAQHVPGESLQVVQHTSRSLTTCALMSVPEFIVSIPHSGQHSPAQLQYPPGQQQPRFFVAGSDGQAFGSQPPADPSAGWRLIQRPALSRSRPLQHGLPRFRFCPAFAHSSRRFCFRSLPPPPLPRFRFDRWRLPPDPPPRSPSDPRPPATASPPNSSSSAASASGLRPITAPPRTRPSAARNAPRRDFEVPNYRVKRSNAIWSTVEVPHSMGWARSSAKHTKLCLVTAI